MKNEFDVFLSRKTEDFHLSDEIYQFLTAKGFDVFDSSYSLERIGETEYGKVIDQTIPISKNFILIFSSIDNINSGWVQHEWQLFLNNKKENDKVGNIILVVTDDVKIEEIPPVLKVYEVIKFSNFKNRILHYLLKNKNETNIKTVGEEFIGRENKIDELKKILINEKNRLVTIVGTGGFGKTRLALEIGKELNHKYSGGVWFVNLVDAETETGVAKSIYDAFNQEMTSSQISAREAILLLLEQRENVLLILDNFEQIVDECSETLDFMLSHLPKAQILVTSTRRLKLSYANLVEIEPLETIDVSVKDPDELKRNESIQLFLNRSSKINREFDKDIDDLILINKICNELQGIPLGIELAASRSDLLNIEEIFEGIKSNNYQDLEDYSHDRQKKHHSLYSAVNWSFNLLTDNEKDLFIQLAIFKTSFTAELAKKIVIIENTTYSLNFTKTLDALVKSSLLKANVNSKPTRFSFPITVYNFGNKVLYESKDAAYISDLIERYGDTYISFLIIENQKSKNILTSKSLKRMHAELENIFSIQELLIKNKSFKKAAEIISFFADVLSIKGPELIRIDKLKYSYDNIIDKNNDYSCRLAIELSKAYQSRGQYDEGDRFGEMSVSIARKIEDNSLLAHSLLQLGKMKNLRGYKYLALVYIEESFSLYKDLDDSKYIAITLIIIGSIKERLGFFDESLERFELAEEIADDNADTIQKEEIFYRKSLAYWHHGKVKKGLEFMCSAQDLAEDIGNDFMKPGHLTTKGLILSDLGQYDEAIESFKKAGEIHNKRGTVHWEAVNNGGWGRTLMMKNNGKENIQESIQFLEKAEKVSRKIFYPENIAFHSGDLGRAYFLNGNLEKAFAKTNDAISIERAIGSTNEHRHFCNLIVMAKIAKELSKDDLLWESIVIAQRLTIKLGINESSEIEKVRKDFVSLILLIKHWETKFNTKAEVLEDYTKGVVVNPPSSISKIKLSSQTCINLFNKIQFSLREMMFEYPWGSIENFTAEKGQTSIKLFSYGSIHNMFSDTPSNNTKSIYPYKTAIGFGIRRLLNYNIPDEILYRPIYQPLTGPNARGLFNVKFTGSISDTVNGVLFDIDISDIAKLRKNEVGYDLIPIICLDWNDHEKDPILAYTLTCPERMYKGKSLTGSDLSPHPKYYRICRDGAAKISNEFLDYFLESSYFSDNKTLVKNWEIL
ncbi:NB-ARC domain-containing protein [uncultured Cyclobacterium sp.]|uniref:NB-ARC domain-containing protein n=1 Tax=uncultured Cyclobacterium sp. TaxID=453820 RepID=UPI0030EEADF9